MPDNIEELLFLAISDPTELVVINEALVIEDYNLVRVLVDGITEDFKRDFEHELVFGDLDRVKDKLPRYRALLTLENAIMELLC